MSTLRNSEPGTFSQESMPKINFIGDATDGLSVTMNNIINKFARGNDALAAVRLGCVSMVVQATTDENGSIVEISQVPTGPDKETQKKGKKKNRNKGKKNKKVGQPTSEPKYDEWDAAPTQQEIETLPFFSAETGFTYLTGQAIEDRFAASGCQNEETDPALSWDAPPTAAPTSTPATIASPSPSTDSATDEAEAEMAKAQPSITSQASATGSGGSMAPNLAYSDSPPSSTSVDSSKSVPPPSSLAIMHTDLESNPLFPISKFFDKPSRKFIGPRRHPYCIRPPLCPRCVVLRAEADHQFQVAGLGAGLDAPEWDHAGSKGQACSGSKLPTPSGVETIGFGPGGVDVTTSDLVNGYKHKDCQVAATKWRPSAQEVWMEKMLGRRPWGLGLQKSPASVLGRRSGGERTT